MNYIIYGGAKVAHFKLKRRYISGKQTERKVLRSMVHDRCRISREPKERCHEALYKTLGKVEQTETNKEMKFCSKLYHAKGNRVGLDYGEKFD